MRDLGAKYGVIERPNNKVWVLDGEKYNGKDAMANSLLDSELQLSVYERVKKIKASGRRPMISKIEDAEIQEELE